MPGAGCPSPTRMEQGEGVAQELPQVPGTPSQQSGLSQHSSRNAAQESGPRQQQANPCRQNGGCGCAPGLGQGMNPGLSTGVGPGCGAGMYPGLRPGMFQQQGFSTMPPAMTQQQQQGPQTGGPNWFGAQWVPRAPGLGPSGCQNLSSANPSMCLGGTNLNMPLGSQNPSMCLGCGTSNIVPFGPQLGGVTPQAASMQEVLGIVGTWSDNQLQTLQQHLSERFVSMQQRRLIPERFGDRGDTGVQTDFVLPQWNVGQLPAPRETGSVPAVPLDVFARSEKWLAPAPTPSATQWRNREDEIIQWSSYLDELVAWAAQASLEFSTEISHAARWPKEITWASLTQAQQARSRRLLAIVRAAFVNHPRCSNLIGVFCEGVPLSSLSGSTMDSGVTQQGNGYELVRQLTLEFSIRSRSEALSMRANIATKSFNLSGQETSPSSVVSDTIRRLDLEVARFSKLLATMPATMDMTGLRISESDLLLILLRSLPETVKNFCLHHSAGDSYEAYRVAAKRWEDQQRLFGDLDNLWVQNESMRLKAPTPRLTRWIGVNAKLKQSQVSDAINAGLGSI